MKYTIKTVSGYWNDLPEPVTPMIVDVPVALEEWDGEMDKEDEGIFYYMDGQPLAPGMIIAGNFVVTGVNV